MNADEIYEMLERSTVPDNPSLIRVIGAFPSREAAEILMSDVLLRTRLVGSSFDLSSLDGITIADDYLAALKGVDRGYEGMGAPTPTRNEFGEGMGMAVPVLRGSEKKSHVILDSALIRPISDVEHLQHKSAVHWLAHELAHVYDHMQRNKAMPDIYGRKFTDPREVSLLPFAMAGWDEYAASRLSAPWGSPQYSSQFQTMMVSMLGTLRDRASSAYDAFLLHRRAKETSDAINEIFGSFFVCFSYLAGHVDGMDRELDDEAPLLAEQLRETSWLRLLTDEYLRVLRELFEIIENWPGKEAYDPLNEVFEAAMCFGGARFSRNAKGVYRVDLGRIVTL